MKAKKRESFSPYTGKRAKGQLPWKS